MTLAHVISIAAGTIIAIIFIYFYTRKNTDQKASRRSPSIASGLAAFFAGDDKQALEELRALALADKGSPEIYLSIGYLYRKMGDLTKAAHIHEILLGNSDIDNEYKPFILTELAKDYLLADMPLKSISLITQTAGADKNPDNMIILAKAYLSISNFDKAINYYLKYNKLTGQEIKGFYCKCMIEKAKAAKDLSTSIKAIKTALNADKQCRPARFITAAILKSEGKHAKSINEYKSIIAENLIRDFNDLKDIEAEFIEAGEETTLKTILKEHLLYTKNPIIAVYVAKKYAENDDKESAKILLKSYLTNTDFNNYAAKAYAVITEDKILEGALKNNKTFVCMECGTSYNNYYDDCKVCGSFDSIFVK